MLHDEPGTDGSVALPAAGSLPARGARLRALLPAAWEDIGAEVRARVPVQVSARAGHIALSSIALGAFVVVAFAAAGTSILVPRASATYPGWEAGPLAIVFGHLALPRHAARLAYTALLFGMTFAYATALLSARSLHMRTIWLFAAGVPLIMLLGPPLQLNDVWNYLGYARLGALHHLDPYLFQMKAESNDPIFTFTSWRNYSSPYGPLFTALTYPLAFLPISIAYWIVKVGIVAAALALIWVVAWCARLLGRDPRLPVLFLAANPVYVFYAVGGFHNDFLMVLPATAALGLLLARRDRLAGAALMLAVAVKPTAIVLLPFLLMAARPPDRRLRVLAGCVLAGVPLLAMSLALFGTAIPNIAQQSHFITGFSIPNVTGILMGIGGSTTDLSRVANVGVVLVILWGLRRRDWIESAGWATVALIASVSWLMPWYVVWALPLAALTRSRALRRTVLVLTVYLVLSFAPAVSPFLASLGIRPLGSPADQAVLVYQARLQS